MTHLENVSTEDLHEALREAEGSRATQRVMVGLNYKEADDVTQTELAERYDIARRTVYSWLCRLDRLENEPPERVIYDDSRGGRPRKLPKEKLSDLEELLEEGPEVYGFCGQLWTGKRVSQVIEQEFGVSVTGDSARRYLKELGWSHKKPQRIAVERDQEAIEQFRSEEWQRIRRESEQAEKTIVFVDETKFRLLPVFRYTWAPKGEEATVETTSSFGYLAVISALTYVPATQEFGLHSAIQRYNFNTQSIFPFLRDVTLDLTRNPLFLLDNWKPHYTAMERLKDEFKETPIDVEAEYFPEYASDLNPVDRVWGHAKHAKLPNYAPRSVDELEETVKETLDDIQSDGEFLRSCIEYAGLEIES